MLARDTLTYQDLLSDSPEPIRVRLAMVRRYRETKNVSLVAREFGTTRKTVRKWVHRFTGALASLKNRYRAPKAPRRGIDERTEKLLIDFRQKHPGLGYDYIHHWLLEHGCRRIPSKKSCYRIWRRHGLLPPRKKKREKKKDLRHIKAKYRPFEKIQIDVKELKDIPNILQQALKLRQKHALLREGLPLYQYTGRDIKTGSLFVALAYEHTRHNAAIFADRVLSHLARYGITPRIIQTDNGTEFVNTRNALEETLFTQVITRSRQTQHHRIPPGAKTFQSDVESSHWIIEREFYDFVSVTSDRNLIEKLRAYQWGFNTKRKNGYKGNKTPLEILRKDHESCYATLPSGIMDFPTCILDEKLDAFLKGGYHVGLPTKINYFGNHKLNYFYNILTVN